MGSEGREEGKWEMLGFQGGARAQVGAEAVAVIGGVDEPLHL